MADVVMKSRTNYFASTDAAGLADLLKSVKTGGEPIVLTTRNGRHMFCCNGDIMGVLTDEARMKILEDPAWADDNPDEAYSFDAFLQALKRCVAPGDACILKTVSYEKMRQVCADAYLITRTGSSYVDFDRILIMKTRSLLADAGWDTQMEG